MSNKINVEDLVCFPEVERVLGEQRAKLELFKALNTPNLLWWEDGTLLNAFDWETSIQGHSFWWNVRRGTHPGPQQTFQDI